MIAPPGRRGHLAIMTSAAPRPIDPGFPGVAPEVVEAYRNAPDNVVAEILDGALSLMPRPRPRAALALVDPRSARHTESSTAFAGSPVAARIAFT